MRKKRRSGIFQAFWPMKVEGKSAKHVINIASEAMSKNNVQGISPEIEGNWDRVWILMCGQKAIVICIFHASVKTKEVKRDWFFPRLVDDIERKTCDYIVEMLRCLNSVQAGFEMFLRQHTV